MRLSTIKKELVTMMHILNFISETITSNSFALVILSISFGTKIYLLNKLLPLGQAASTIRTPLFLLLGVLVGSLFGDVAWIIKLIHKLFLFDKPYSCVVFWTRISWAFVIIQYQSFALFIESFFVRSFTLKNRHKITILCSSIYSLYFLIIALFDSNLTDIASRDYARATTDPSLIPLEFKVMQQAAAFMLFLLIIPSAIAMMRKLYKSELPALLSRQVKIIIYYLFAPYVFMEVILAIQLLSPITQTAMQHNYTAIVAVSTVLITGAVAYCINTVLNLRFLNSAPYVEAPHSEHFVLNFKTLLESCSSAKQKSDLGSSVKTFFEQLFAIPQNHTTLVICCDGIYSDSAETKLPPHHTELPVKQFFANPDTARYLREQQILLYNEIEFSHFYQELPVQSAILSFMQTLNAEMFIPIFQYNKMVAYVIVNRQHDALYGTRKRDEIAMFTQNMITMLHLMHNRSRRYVYESKEKLEAELDKTIEEIARYRKSMKSLLWDSKETEVGVILYKNKRFSYSNKIACTLMGEVNLNAQKSHPSSQTVRKLSTLAIHYNATQRTYFDRDKNTRLLVMAVPEPECDHDVVIMVYHLQNRDQYFQVTSADSAYYLEITPSGAILNQLIPGDSKESIDFKVMIVKAVDNQKGILLTIPADEVNATVAVLQYIASRKKLHTITLDALTNAIDIVPRIFGISPIFGIELPEPPLLETLNGSGILFIQNAEFLDFEAQKLLAQYIAYGTYTTYKSNALHTSDVRIICSTNQNKGSKLRISDDLLAQLTPLSVSLAPYHAQMEAIEAAKHTPPARAIEYVATQYHPAYSFNNHEIASLVKPGRAVLRDKKTMTILWAYFKDQTTLASVLGVDRSSVHRRCKQYGLK